jgi:hypothetical protein
MQNRPEVESYTRSHFVEERNSVQEHRLCTPSPLLQQASPSSSKLILQPAFELTRRAFDRFLLGSKLPLAWLLIDSEQNESQQALEESAQRRSMERKENETNLRRGLAFGLELHRKRAYDRQRDEA